MDIRWYRGEALMAGSLDVADGWRQTVLGWRASVANGKFGEGPGFWALGVPTEQRRRRGIQADAMAVRPWFGEKPSGAAFDAGLRPNDIIVAVNGEGPNLFGRSFLVWFRLQYEQGDQVTLSVVNPRGETRQMTYALGRKQ